ncbi:biotin transport system substrate-specific component [Desulfohalotomaculum tongense]|uniref:biotin transporter BioY n=1 Tax=Desulforadius tongensis TaxID=1216062 RepID=UPI00195D43E0|nr:biotin transporter BioY [Desulforadius tongensis]MBM7856040.1 biotin transport system substrate-specific component [Desulforadius tongensis]
MKLQTKEMALVGTMAAFMAVVSVVFRFYPIAFGAVPFSLLPFIVILTGGILGARLGAWSMAVYIMMGLAGLPVFATEPFGGVTYVLKPTFGFVLAYVPAAFVTGFIIGKRKNAGWLTYGLAMLLGMFVIYLFGLPYLYYITNIYLGKALTVKMMLAGMKPFMVLDVLKAAAAAVVAKLVVRRLSGVLENNNSKSI